MDQSQRDSDRPTEAGAGPETIERLLAWHARRTPDKLALIDPANRDILQNPAAPALERSWDYAALEQAVARLAAHFERLGLAPGDYVAMQMPNLSEAYIALLALLRARLVPCLMPLAWGSGEIDRALERLKPAALLGCGSFEAVDHSLLLRDAAARHMSVRHVWGIGHRLADGVDDLSPRFDEPSPAPTSVGSSASTGLNDLALVTFIDPATCVPHSHGQMLASGLLQVMETGLAGSDRLLSAYPLSSLVGLSAFAYPWLITGASLLLHHPFDKALLRRQLTAGEVNYFAAPDAVIASLLRGRGPRPAKLARVWRHGHLPGDGDLPADGEALFDLWNLADIGVVPARRAGSRPAGLFPHGRICLPADGARELCLAAGEVIDGTLRIRGRLFPAPALIGSGLEWFSLRRRVKDEAIDTGIAAFEGPDGSIFIGDPAGDAATDAAAE